MSRGLRTPPCPGAALVSSGGADVVCEAAAVYRPRHPERSALYRLFERHGESCAVVDKILAHRKEKQLTSPFEPRAPPAA